MGPGEGWKRLDCTKMQLPKGGIDTEVVNLASDAWVKNLKAPRRGIGQHFPRRELSQRSTMYEGTMFSPAKFSLFQECFPETTCHLTHFLVQTQKWRRCHGTRLCFPCFLWAWEGRKSEWSVPWVQPSNTSLHFFTRAEGPQRGQVGRISLSFRSVHVSCLR